MAYRYSILTNLISWPSICAGIVAGLVALLIVAAVMSALSVKMVRG
jgi:hypothetical protein